MDKLILFCLILSAGLLFLFFMSYVNADFLSFIKEKASPSDWISEEQIEVFSDKIIIHLKNGRLTKYSNTNSMDPVLDYRANSIEIKPKSNSEISVGDIIAYSSGNEIIVHRVTDIGKDEKGWFCKVKGDNSSFKEKIRFSQIVGVVVIIIY